MSDEQEADAELEAEPAAEAESEPDPDPDPDPDSEPESEPEEPDTEGAASETDETVEAADEEAASEGLQDGDFVKLAYTMRTVEDGTLVDTTDEEVAEEEGIDTEEQDFGPRTVVLGAGHVFDAVEDALRGGEVGDTGSVEIPATEAFGEYDREEVRTISADRIPEDSRHPGAHVNIDGEQGHVETIIGGRARVDFNHPLAGEDIEYDYEIVDVVEDRLERAQGLLGMYIDVDLDMHFGTEEDERTTFDEDEEEEVTETVELEVLYIEATPQLTMNQQWMFSKQQIAQELMNRVGVDRVVVRETIDGGGMGGLGGMMGGMGGGGLEEALEEADVDVDADELAEEIEAGTDPEAEAEAEADADADAGEE